MVCKSVVYASDFLSAGVGRPPGILTADFLATGFFCPGVNLAIFYATLALDAFLIPFDFLVTPPTTLGFTVFDSADFNAAAPFSNFAIAVISVIEVFESLNPYEKVSPLPNLTTP